MNIAAYVKNHANHNGNKIAIIHSNTKYTYKKIWSLIEGVCEILISKGVAKGDRIGLSMKDCLLYTSPSPRDQRGSRMPSSA